MASSGMLHRVAFVRTDVSEELSASFIRVTRIGELGMLAYVPSSPILVTLMKESLRSFERSGLTRATRRNIPEDAILHSHRGENLKSYRVTCLFRKKLDYFLKPILLPSKAKKKKIIDSPVDE
jgi:hypothetical protein